MSGRHHAQQEWDVHVHRASGEHARSRGEPRRLQPSLLAEAIGPCFTDASIARVLNIPTAEVIKRRARNDLLALRTADGIYWYPSFQVRNGGVVPGLRAVLRTLRAGIDDPWTWALWLNSKPPIVGSEAPRPSRLEQLFAGEIDLVTTAARHSAYSWQS